MSAALNLGKVSNDLIEFGSEFHSLGANTMNELSYWVWNLAFADVVSGGTLAHTPLLG